MRVTARRVISFGELRVAGRSVRQKMLSRRCVIVTRVRSETSGQMRLGDAYSKTLFGSVRTKAIHRPTSNTKPIANAAKRCITLL